MTWEPIANLRGPVGKEGLRGPQGLPGAATLPTDEAVAAYVETEGTSATRRALDASFLAKGELFVSVKDYGAKGDYNPVTKVGTDDKVAVTAAITAAVGSFGQGGTLYFPAGNYWWASIVVLQSNLTLTGPGVIWKGSPSDINYAMFCTKSSGTKGYGSGGSNLTARGMTFRASFEASKQACAFALHHSDNVQIDNCTFQEMQGIGHTIDLGGCSNVKIRDSRFIGFKATADGYARAECIQVDISNAGAASAPDDPGSYDGLPTINVTVDNCQFLPLTVGGVKYPAPNPIGSHSKREGAWHKNINFINCYVEDPYVDLTSATPGAIHFVGLDGGTADNNDFVFTTPGICTILGLYSTNKGAAASASNESGASNPTVTIAPLMVKNFTWSNNRIKGAGALQHLAAIRVESVDSSTVRAQDIKLLDAALSAVGGSYSTNFIQASYVDRLTVTGLKSDGPVRALNASFLKDLKVSLSNIVSPRADAMLVADSVGVIFQGDTITDPATSSIQLTRCTDVQIIAPSTTLPAGGARVIGLDDCNQFSVTGGNLRAPSGTAGIQVYSSSRNGAVRGVIVSGGTTTHVVNTPGSAGGVTAEQNILL